MNTIMLFLFMFLVVAPVLYGLLFARPLKKKATTRKIKKKYVRYPKHIIEDGCIRKEGHTEEIASKIIDKAAKRKKLLFYYKCDFCRSFHITKKLNGGKLLKVI